MPKFELYVMLSNLRVLFLNMKDGISIGKQSKLDWRVRIDIIKGAKLFISRGVYLRSRSRGYHAGMPFPTSIFADVKGAVIRIGERSRLNGVYIHAKKKVEIGKNCVIASGVNILDSNGHKLYSVDRTIGKDKPSSVLIGDNVWIGINAVILKGTEIGSNSVIAAGSVVKGNIPSNSLVVGNPGIVVKKLNNI